MRRRYVLNLITLLVAFGLTGCFENETAGDASAATCGNGVAQIAIGDGYTEVLCGCAEPQGTVYGAGSTLTCTVSAGSYVFFQFLGITLKHQVVSTGGPGFAPGPLIDPSQDPKIRAYAVQLTASGTYPFEDVFNNGLVGQIIVP